MVWSVVPPGDGMKDNLKRISSSKQMVEWDVFAAVQLKRSTIEIQLLRKSEKARERCL